MVTCISWQFYLRHVLAVLDSLTFSKMENFEPIFVCLFFKHGVGHFESEVMYCLYKGRFFNYGVRKNIFLLEYLFQKKICCFCKKNKKKFELAETKMLFVLNTPEVFV